MLLLFLPLIVALKTLLHLPKTPQLSPTPSKIKTFVSGGSDSCFLTTLVIQSKSFLVRVDTGSSDTVIPHDSLPNYTGPTLNFPIGNEIVSNTYGDRSGWKGFVERTNVEMNGVKGIAPIAVITEQSNNPAFETGVDGISGLFGIGFVGIASTISTPRTVVQAWYNDRVIGINFGLYRTE
jgi:hypothetical protein